MLKVSTSVLVDTSRLKCLLKYKDENSKCEQTHRWMPQDYHIKSNTTYNHKQMTNIQDEVKIGRLYYNRQEKRTWQ